MVKQGRALIVCPCTEPRVANTSAGHCHWLSGDPALNRRSSSSSSRLSDIADTAIVKRVRINDRYSAGFESSSATLPTVSMLV